MKTNTQTQAIVLPKKVYTKPRLVNYGEVRALTQGGSKGGNEGTSMSTDQML
jgi:hypothetical protein